MRRSAAWCRCAAVVDHPGEHELILAGGGRAAADETQ
jgi:hypothetical protein